MLILKDVTIKDQKNHILLDKFNYSLGNEDKVGIIGEEGNGKSTLLKAIYIFLFFVLYCRVTIDVRPFIYKKGDKSSKTYRLF